jgi:O-antigen ligase
VARTRRPVLGARPVVGPHRAEGIWTLVWEKAIQHPVIGWGFSTPWVPTDPHFDGWIVDHGQTVMQAHNMWLDVSSSSGRSGCCSSS